MSGRATGIWGVEIGTVRREEALANEEQKHENGAGQRRGRLKVCNVAFDEITEGAMAGIWICAADIASGVVR